MSVAGDMSFDGVSDDVDYSVYTEIRQPGYQKQRYGPEMQSPLLPDPYLSTREFKGNARQNKASAWLDKFT